MTDYQFKTDPFPHQLEEWELSRDEPSRALLWEQGCVSGDTEVLTEGGWMRIADLPARTHVACWEPKSRGLSFLAPTSPKVFEVSEGVRIRKSGYTDQLLSTTHRVPFAGGGDGAGPVTLAMDLLLDNKPLPPLPLSVSSSAAGVGARVAAARLKLHIMHEFLGKPYQFGAGTLSVTRLDMATIWGDEDRAAQVRNVLQAAGVASSTHVHDPSGQKVVSYQRPEPLPVSPFQLGDGLLPALLNAALEWGNTSPPGHLARIVCPTKRVADIVQYAALVSGRFFSLAGIRPAGKLAVEWVLTERKLDGGNLPPKYAVTTSRIPEGKVYALTVPTGFVLYRRSGLIFPSGNCGKSKPVVDTAGWLYRQGKVNAVVVVAPNGVHRNWIEGEVPDHTPEDIMTDTFGVAYSTSKATTKKHQALIGRAVTHRGLSWFAISYEAFATDRGKEAVKDFLQKRRVLFVLDEAHKAKNHQSPRVKSLIKAGQYAPYRRILTGTPVAVGPFDLYSQLLFLDARFWAGHQLHTYTEFKNHFGIFQKQWNPNIVRMVRNPVTGQKELQYGGYYDALTSYRRLDELAAILQTVATRKTKAEVLPFLPPKVYERRFFDLTPEMRRMYDELAKEFMTWVGTVAEGSNDYRKAVQGDMFCGICHGSGELEEDGYIYPCPSCGHGDGQYTGGTPVYAELAIVRLVRLQQITSGFIPVDDPASDPIYVIPGDNPRLNALLEVIQERTTPVIVWARYKREIDDILARLSGAGISAVRYDGEVSEEGRAESKARFQGFRAVYDRDGALVGREEVPDVERARVFVGNPSAGSAGLTLTAAKTVVYYSNSFKLIDRLQSEDRAHRIGQADPVTYVDLEANQTVDRMIVKNLRDKFDIAAAITGDNLREWIE